MNLPAFISNKVERNGDNCILTLTTKQAKIAAIVGSRQSAVARFESGEAHVPAEVMIRYADYFDVSLDYIFGRTDKPQGKLYEGKMKIEKVYPEMDKFIEMCFDPSSPINERLKKTLRQMLKEG